MSASIKYAYLKGRTWLYRRNYPQDVALALGAQALKQSLKTGDPSVARVRAAELNAHYEKLVSQARSATTRILEGATEQPPGDASDPGWSRPSADAIRHLRATLAASEGLQFGGGRQQPRVLIRDIGNLYLNKRSNQLRPGGFKSVRYSVGLFLSKYGKQSVSELTRDHGREFLELTSQLSPVIGKSEKTRGLTLDQLVRFSSEGPHRITARTHRRIAVTGYELKDGCDNLKDLRALELALNPTLEESDEQRRVCGIVPPTRDEVIAKVRSAPGEVWEGAKQ